MTYPFKQPITIQQRAQINVLLSKLDLAIKDEVEAINFYSGLIEAFRIVGDYTKMNQVTMIQQQEANHKQQLLTMQYSLQTFR